MAGLTITGDKKVSRRFREVAKRAENIELAWPEVGRYMSRAVARQFTSRGAFMGTPWRPLKAETRLYKLRSGGGSRMLVRSGAMRNSFTGRPMNIEIYRGNSAEFGSAEYKVGWHQYGTHRNGKRAIPPRPMLRVTPLIASDVKDIIKKYVVGR